MSKWPTAAERQGCAPCAAARDWLAGQWRRITHLVAGGRSWMAALPGRIRPLLTPGAPEHRVAATRGLSRRRAYPGSRTRRYELYVPPGVGNDSPAPLLMVLHGCRQDSTDIRRIANFDEIATREGFIVAYPFVTSYSGIRIRNCWGWWLESEIRPGAGEVEDLWQMVVQISDHLNVDSRRIHIAGLSSGAGMAVAAMVAHHHRFASGAAVAGVPYSETARAVAHPGAGRVAFTPTEEIVHAMRSVVGDGGRPSPIFIVHSNDDPVVGIQAARNLRDSWAACYGIDTARPAVEKSGKDGAAAWVHASYREARRRSAIETFFMEGPGHGWYGGNPGRFSFSDAPDISALMWRFFKRHPLHMDSLRGGLRPPIREAG